MDSDEEDTPAKVKSPKFPVQMFISEGNKYLRIAKYETAIQFFDAALEMMPNNAESLIGRAKCQMRLGMYSEAKKDAEKALKVNPKSCEAKQVIGEAEYSFGDFEKAFLTFYRGHLTRRNYEGLRLGHQMCRKAIDNALKPDKPMILDEQDEASLSTMRSNQDEKQTSKSKTRNDLSDEIGSLDVLLGDSLTKSVHSKCEDLKKYVKHRQSFWRAQNPTTTKRRSVASDLIAKEQTDGETKMPRPTEPAQKILPKEKTGNESSKSIPSETSDRQTSGEVSEPDFKPESSLESNLIESVNTLGSAEKPGDDKVKTEELSGLWFDALFGTPSSDAFTSSFLPESSSSFLPESSSSSLSESSSPSPSPPES